MKRRIITSLKILIPAAIIGWLLGTIEPAQRDDLWNRPKDWRMLGLAFVTALTAVCITFVRWYLLIRTLNIPFRLRDAFRLGFLGYLMNFVSIGSVGGDLFKAVFIAREQPKRRAEAVATVVVDRMIGLYALLLVTSTAILLSDIPEPTPTLSAICNLTFLTTALGGMGVLMVLIPGFTRGSLSEFLTELPKIGDILGKLIASIRMYRNKYGVMLVILLMSMAVHGMLAVSVYLIAAALFQATPTVGEHMILVPLCNVAGALPFTPAGLGTFEGAMEALYQLVPAEGAGDVAGIVVALVFRLMTIAIAAVGVVYYWTCRKEVRDVMLTAEQSETEVQPAR